MSTSQIHASEVYLNEKEPLETEQVRVTDASGAGTSDGNGGSVTESSSVVLNNNENSIDSIQKGEQVSSNDTSSSHFLTNDYSSLSSVQSLKHANGQEFKRYGDLGFVGSLDVNQSHGRKSNDLENYTGGLVGFPYGTSDQSTALRSQGSQDFESSAISQLHFHRNDESYSKEGKFLSDDYSISNAGSSHVSVTSISPQNSIGTVLQNEPINVSGSKSSSLYEGTFALWNFNFKCFLLSNYRLNGLYVS